MLNLLLIPQVHITTFFSPSALKTATTLLLVSFKNNNPALVCDQVYKAVTDM